MDGTGRTRGRRWVGFALIALMAFGAMAGGAAAHDPKPPHDEHGELTYHDSPDGEATNDLECEFWVKGTNVTHAEGTITAAHDHPNESPHSHAVGEFEAETNGSGGHEFLAGPFQLHETGDYTQLYAVMNDTDHHRTGGHFVNYQACEDPDEHESTPPPHCATNVDAEALQDGDVQITWNASERAETYVVFRVGGQAESGSLSPIAARTLAEVDTTSYVDDETEPDTEYSYQIHAKDGPRDAQCGSATDSVTTPAEGPPQPPQCPADLRAEAQQNGDIRLNWQGVVDAESYHVYRATADGEFELLTETEISEDHDTETEPGTTYRYTVTAVNEHGESDMDECEVVEVTAIPFFGNPALVAMAAIGSVGAVAAVGTRRG